MQDRADQRPRGVARLAACVQAHVSETTLGSLVELLLRISVWQVFSLVRDSLPVDHSLDGVLKQGAKEAGSFLVAFRAIHSTAIATLEFRSFRQASGDFCLEVFEQVLWKLANHLERCRVLSCKGRVFHALGTAAMRRDRASVRSKSQS